MREVKVPPGGFRGEEKRRRAGRFSMY